MKATFLEASVPLTKTFQLVNGVLEKVGHPRIINYTSHEENFEMIEELHTHLNNHATLGHCYLKGSLTRPLVDESRAGTTDPNTPTRLHLLDVDGVKNSSIEDLLNQLGFGQCDHIIQYSSSMGVVPERGLSAHIFILLDRDYTPAVLKQCLMHANLTVPTLKTNLALTRTCNALRWSLDITTDQNDKLIYITPPILEDGVIDHFQGERIQLVKGKERVATIGVLPNAEANKALAETALNELRAKAGLAKRKPDNFKASGSIEYLVKPDAAIITSMKTERGFVYFNLNGGDSWGYYHPISHPEFILNFKNEPIYRTQDLLPEYWAQVKTAAVAPKAAPVKANKEGNIYLAFRDFKTAMYWNGCFNQNSQALNLSNARNEKQLKDYMTQHGQMLGDFVPDWTLEYNPISESIVDVVTKTVNIFVPSTYMKLQPKNIIAVPRTIRRVIFHALGNDEAAFEHFMNWLACIMQYRCQCGTAWVMHGNQGTGKGITYKNILVPLFGMKSVIAKRMEELESQFNQQLETSLIVMIDEADMDSYRNSGKINASLKNYITEGQISIRRMYAAAYMAANYTNWLFYSNMATPVLVPMDDRRFNIGAFQEERLVISDKEVDSIENELYDFYSYLMSRKADRNVARTPLNNTAKATMQHIGRTTIDVASQALRDGDFQFFLDQKPTGDISLLPASAAVLAARYIGVLDQVKKKEHKTITRDEIHVLFDWVVGNMPIPPGKFTSLLKHHKIHIATVTRDGTSHRGIRTDWKLKEAQ